MTARLAQLEGRESIKWRVAKRQRLRVERQELGVRQGQSGRWKQNTLSLSAFAHADLVVPLVAHRHFVGTSFEWAGHQVCWRVTVCRHCGVVVGLRHMYMLVSRGWVGACCDGK